MPKSMNAIQGPLQFHMKISFSISAKSPGILVGVGLNLQIDQFRENWQLNPESSQ